MMIGSAVQSTLGKKILGVFVALAMVLTMSNISAYFASASENAEDQETNETIEPTTTVTEAPVEVKAEAPVEQEMPKTEAPVEQEMPKTEAPAEEADEPETETDDIESYEASEDNEVVLEEKDAVDTKEDPYAKHSITLRINFYGVTAESVEKVVAGPVSKNFSIEPVSLTPYVEAYSESFPGSAVERIEYPDGEKVSLAEKADSKTVSANIYYSEDNNNDFIADKFQGTVTYYVDGGTWSDGTSEPIKEPVTFWANGNPSNSSSAQAQLKPPQVKKNDNDTGVWWNDLPKNNLVIGYEENLVYTFRYNANADAHGIMVTIRYLKDGDEVYRTTKYETMADKDGNISMTADSLRNIHKVLNKPSISAYADGHYELDSHGVDSFQTVTVKDTEMGFKDAGIVDVDFCTDANNDFTADKYQATVSFGVENGTLDNSSDAIKEITFADVNATQEITMPATTANKGYENGAWYDENGNVVAQAGEAIELENTDKKLMSYNTFTYKYEKAEFPYYVYFYDEDNGEASIADTIEGTALYEDPIYAKDFKLNKYADDDNNYVFVRASRDTMTIDVSGNDMYLYYSKDNNFDGIPDKYQVKVTYSAVNGTVNGEEQVAEETVTLYDSNGNFSKKGTGHLTHIPKFAPLEGFEKGKWGAAGKPTGYTKIKADTNFVITYSEKVEAPEADDPEDGNGNDSPVATTPAAGNTIAQVVGTDDDATETEEAEEATIEDDENALAEAEEATIADDENALAGFEEGVEQTNGFDWLPFAIGAGIVLAGLFLFLVARRKKDDEEEANQA